VNPYERNRLTMPRSIEENVTRLRSWQEMFKGDGFIFDYHFFADHVKDPGYAQISKVLFDDIKNLHKLGLNGTVNCQLTRPFFPTGLGLYLMAKALWNREAGFERESNAYYINAFGKRGLEVKEYLTALSGLFDPPYLRREKTQADEEAAQRFDSIGAFIDGFDFSYEDLEPSDLQKSMRQDISQVPKTCPGIRKSWEYLRQHGQVCKLCAKALSYKARGKRAEAMTIYGDIASWARINDKNLHHVLDSYRFINTWKNIIEDDEPTLT
jgi:hypothetical protein